MKVATVAHANNGQKMEMTKDSSSKATIELFLKNCTKVYRNNSTQRPEFEPMYHQLLECVMK